jgi:hypothetical protein
LIPAAGYNEDRAIQRFKAGDFAAHTKHTFPRLLSKSEYEDEFEFEDD